MNWNNDAYFIHDSIEDMVAVHGEGSEKASRI